MDRHGYNSGSIATTATTADTIIIPTERITQKKGIVELIIIMTVVQFQHLTRIVVKVNGKEKIDMTPAQYRQYLQRFSKRHSSTAYPAATDTSWSIVFYATELDEGDDRRYRQQLEPGDVSIELTKNNTPGAGTVAIEWAYSLDDPLAFLEISRQGIGIAASATREEKTFSQEGNLKGYSLNTVGLTELRFFWNAGGAESPVWDPLIEATGAGVIEEQRLDDGSTATDPIARRIPKPVPCRIKLILTTAAGWAGTANEIVTYRTKPVVAKAA